MARTKTTVRICKNERSIDGDNTFRATFPKQFMENNMDLANEEFTPKRTLLGNIKLTRVK